MSEPVKPRKGANVAEAPARALLAVEIPGCDDAQELGLTRVQVDRIAESAKTGPSYAQAATHAQVNGYYQKAIELYDEAIAARDLSRISLAKVYNNRGAAYRSLGLGPLAIDDYKEAMRLRPDYAIAFFNRGIAYGLGNRMDLAFEDFSRSIQLDSGFAEPYYHRGLIHAERAQHEEAISDFSRAIRLAPCFDDAYFGRGRVFESMGNFEHALDDFKKSYALNPRNKDYEIKFRSLSSR